jgi:hypothetical protein
MYAFIIQYRPFGFVTVEGAIMLVFTSKILEKLLSSGSAITVSHFFSPSVRRHNV